MTALEEFYEAYLHYSVSQRLFEDRCRQLTESDGTVSERQDLVDETLRLAMCVTNNVIDLEPLLSEAADELRNGGGDRDILKALSLVSNTIREDRDRADSYTLFVTARRSGNTVRRPRKPRVANPFEFVEEDYEETGEDPVEEEEETVVVTPTPKPARIRVKPKRPAPIIVPEDPVEEEETTGESEEETQEEELVEEDPVEDESEDVIEEEEPEEETQEEELVKEDPVEEEETAPVVGPVPPAPNEGAEEDPVEEDEEESPVVTPAPARAKPKRPAPVVVPEDPVKDEETEEDEEEPAHPAALDRPRPKRKFKPRTEEPPEEDFIEYPDVPKRGLGSRLHNIVTALTSHIPRRK